MHLKLRATDVSFFCRTSAPLSVLVRQRGNGQCLAEPLSFIEKVSPSDRMTARSITLLWFTNVPRPVVCLEQFELFLSIAKLCALLKPRVDDVRIFLKGDL